jgi:hypothetical protein
VQLPSDDWIKRPMGLVRTWAGLERFNRQGFGPVLGPQFDSMLDQIGGTCTSIQKVGSIFVFEFIRRKLLSGHYHSESISNLLLPSKMNDRSTRLIALLALIRRVRLDCGKYESLVALVLKDYLVIANRVVG